MLFKRSGDAARPIALNLFKDVIGTALMALTVAVQLALTDPGPEPFGPPGDVAVLAISGVLGIGVADTLFFYGLERLRVGLVAVVDCLYTPLVVLMSWQLLGEVLRPIQYVGGALVLVGILVSARWGARRSGAPAPEARRLAAGAAWCAGGLAVMAFAIVYAKPVLERTDVFRATLVRLAAGTAALALLTPVLPGGRGTWAIFRPAPVWRHAVPGAVLGTWLAMIFWVGGFKWANASVAAILNQTSTFWALLLAALFLGERLTPRRVLAVALGFAGVLVVSRGGA